MAAEAAQGGIPLEETVPLVTTAGHPSGQGDDDDAVSTEDNEHDTASVSTIGSGNSSSSRGGHHPITSTAAGRNATGSRPGSLTRLNGVALVISLQIGSGIFTVPSQVAQFTTTPGWALVCWFVAGLLVWTGAASFVELGVRFPRNGGIQEYLRACYGDFMAFLFAFTWVVLAKPAAQAAIATIAARYLLRAALPAGAGDAASSDWLARAVALLCIGLVTTVNCLGATTGARAANAFLFLKLAALAAIVAVGFVGWLLADAGGVPSSDRGWFGLTPEMARMSPLEWMGNFATATFGALFCYGGWETVRLCRARFPRVCARPGARGIPAKAVWLVRMCGLIPLSLDRIRGRRYGELAGGPACRGPRGHGHSHHGILPHERSLVCLLARRGRQSEQDDRSGETNNPT